MSSSTVPLNGAGNAMGAGGVPLHLVGDLQARLRAHAIQEAARRLKQRREEEAQARARELAAVNAELSHAEGDQTTGDGGTSVLGDVTGQTSVFLDGKPLEEEEDDRTEKLQQALKEERERNDVEWTDLQHKLAHIQQKISITTDTQEDDLARRIREKDIQLAQMQFHIERLEQSASDLGPDAPSLVREIKAQGSVSDVIHQLEDALLDAETEIARERRAFANERQLLSDLELVHEGMQMRQRQLERRSTQLTEDELAEQLKERLKSLEAQLGNLLGALIRTSNDLFADDEAPLRPQLRSFLDALMNRSWDRPTDPYVDVGKYPKVLINFLIRANVAQEHPRDARRLRLVPFQKGTRGA